MSKNVLILMISGSEVRQFGHSGMISKLLDNGVGVIVAARFVDQDLRDQFDPRVECLPLINEQLSPMYHRLQFALDRVHEIMENTRGKSKWIDEVKKPNKTIRRKVNSFLFELFAQIISRFDGLYKHLLLLEMRFEKREKPQKWIEFFQHWKIDAIIVSTPRSEMLQPALIAARQLGKARLLFFHSIKDISAKGRLVHPFSSIGVWNQWMKNELLRQNPFIESSSIHITGCSHFDCVEIHDLLLSEEAFRKKIGAKPNSKLLLYPAAVQWVLPDQGRYIWNVVKAINEGKLPENIQIIIRTNPMDNTDYFSDNFNNCSYVLVAKSNWRAEKDAGWNFQRRDDLVMYNSLLHYSTLCFGIPSTVTVECAISKLPVINIGFDLSDPRPPRSMKSFWKAEFYQEEVRHGIATLCENEADLISQIKTKLLSGNQLTTADYSSYFSDFLGVPPHESVSKYVDLIKKSINKGQEI